MLLLLLRFGVEILQQNLRDFDSNKGGKRLVIQLNCFLLLYLFEDRENQSKS